MFKFGLISTFDALACFLKEERDIVDDLGCWLIFRVYAIKSPSSVKAITSLFCDKGIKFA